MNKWVELLFGLILVVGTIGLSWMSSAYSWVWFGKDFNFLHPAWIFLKGGLFWLMLMIGALLVILGLNDLRD